MTYGRAFWLIGMLFAAAEAFAQPPSPSRDADAVITAMTAMRVAKPLMDQLEVAEAEAADADAAFAARYSFVSDQIIARVGKNATPEVLDAALRPYGPALRRSAQRYFGAEDALNKKMSAAWASFNGLHRMPALINEPVRLALFNLQIELRRTLGPKYHTQTRGLQDDKGCAGDLNADRMIYGYGQAITTLVPTDREVAIALERIALQIACLSSKQVMILEVALAISYEKVADILTAHGLGKVERAFTRYLLPIQVLVLDARKHRGPKSRTWVWIDTYLPSLKAEVNSVGWPGGTLWLWDRLAGRIAGFPLCSGSEHWGTCVDPGAFLDSIDDPRALGRGDCAFAAMVSKGTTTLPDGQPRYVCPSFPCESTIPPPSAAGSAAITPEAKPAAARTPSPIASTPTRSATSNLPWPELTTDDIAVMRGFCAGAEGSRMQGVETGQCSFSTAPKNPFESYERCMIDAVNGGQPTAADFAGVPMSNLCKFGQEQKEPAPTPPSPSPDPAQPKAEPSDDHPWWKDILMAVLRFFGGEVGSIGGDVATDPAPVLGTAQIVTEQRLRDERMLNGDYAGYLELHGQKPADIAAGLNRPQQGRSCLDELDCSDTCSALGQSIATARACNSTFMNDLLTAAGIPVRTPPVKPTG